MVMAVIVFLSLISVLVVTSADLSSRSRIQRIRAQGGPDSSSSSTPGPSSGGGALDDIHSLRDATLADGSASRTDHQDSAGAVCDTLAKLDVFLFAVAARDHAHTRKQKHAPFRTVVKFCIVECARRRRTEAVVAADHKRAHSWSGYTLGSTGQKNAARHAEPMGKTGTDREQYKKSATWSFFSQKKAGDAKRDASPQKPVATGSSPPPPPPTRSTAKSRGGGSSGERGAQPVAGRQPQEGMDGAVEASSGCTGTDGTCDNGGFGKNGNQHRDGDDDDDGAAGGQGMHVVRAPRRKEGGVDARRTMPSGKKLDAEGSASGTLAAGGDMEIKAGGGGSHSDSHHHGDGDSEGGVQKEGGKTSAGPEDMQVLLKSTDLDGERHDMLHI
jgi:hypothetical protein